MTRLDDIEARLSAHVLPPEVGRDVAALITVARAAEAAAPAFRVALLYTEAADDALGATELIGCRVAERALAAALEGEP